ncbi:DNA glycosylase AlkZ-like family protein [Paenibacillus pasadenensis]|uniref:DNA glycosylase AlkZ-like family protein n=1 Tax=Paenibacillus pasadenensis TaxID=217090 RepID=UPI00041038DB|nr:crosslink repair DNA glycosylase YcaQ family protein [Paenibacillus pasadenensis]
MAHRKLKLSRTEARRFLLDYHGLGPERRYTGKAGIMDYIRQAGCIQFDPLDPAGRNAELVLQSRVERFEPSQLDELLYADRLLVDGMDKVMSIYPTADWPAFRRTRERARSRYGSIPEVEAFVPVVREALEARGPLLSRELESGVKLNWAWSPARQAKATMESMYLWGELVIDRKQRNQRVYQLAEKLLPEELLDAPDPHPADEDYARWRVLRRVGGVGLLSPRMSDAWVGTYFLKAAERTRIFRELAEQGRLVEVETEGLSAPHYARTDDLERWLDSGSAERWSSQPARTSFLAPLDNMLWDRRLIRELFDFAYIWEVYKPAAIRLFGYYTLPVLQGEAFVARMEPGRLASGERAVLGWWPEPGRRLTRDSQRSLALAFSDFRAYLGCDRLAVSEQAASAEPRLERLANSRPSRARA